jgi:hypothetical protein
MQPLIRVLVQGHKHKVPAVNDANAVWLAALLFLDSRKRAQ